MKKILYVLTVFISLFITTQSVNAETCYYKADGLGFYKELSEDVDVFYFYADVQYEDPYKGYSPIVSFNTSFEGNDQFHNKNGSNWIIDNWKEKGKHYSEYEPTGKCPQYMIYEQNDGILGWGDDYVYFSDNKDNLEKDMYALPNFSLSDEVESDTIIPGKCQYFTTIKSSYVGEVQKLLVTVDPTAISGKEFNWYIITAEGTANEFVDHVHEGTDFMYHEYSIGFDTTEFEADGKFYTFPKYYKEKGTCPTYTFDYSPGAGTVVLTPPRPGGSNVDSGMTDTNYKTDLECEYTFSKHNIDLKLLKGATVDGKKLPDKICAKYSNNTNYVCSNSWTDSVALPGTNLPITILDQETANYFKREYLDKNRCPENNGSDILVNKYEERWFYIETAEENLLADYMTSKKFKELLGDVKTPLSSIAPQALSYELRVDGNTITLNDIEYGYGVCKQGECKEGKYQTEQALRNVKSYCNALKKENPKRYEAGVLELRKDECTSFDAFYDRLVQEGIISNLAQGCGFISDDLRDKMNWILDLVKIAGPILAVLLGMLDFVKVLATGDADKGMKEAWKRFQTRLIAAVLLFLVPFILEILITTILPEKYIDEDPFCYIGE